MLYFAPPADFNPKARVTACYMMHNGEVLLLKRAKEKDYGGTWCVPGGKVDPGEKDIETNMRETLEETGIILSEEDSQFVQEVYVRYPEYDITYVIFVARPSKRTEVTIRETEHETFAWVTPQEAEASMPLIPHLGDCFHIAFK